MQSQAIGRRWWNLTYRSYSVFPLRLLIKTMQWVIAATQASRVFLSWATWSVIGQFVCSFKLENGLPGLLVACCSRRWRQWRKPHLWSLPTTWRKSLHLSRSENSYLFASLVLLLILLKMSVLKPSRTSLISLISYLSDPLKMIYQQSFWYNSDMYRKS